MSGLIAPARLLNLRFPPRITADRSKLRPLPGAICSLNNSRHSAVQAEELSDSSKPVELSIGRKLIWFHHIKSSKKKRDIKEWGAELKLGGYCKPGFPGVLIFEGEAKNAAEYLRRIKRLKWQHLQVRGQEEESVASGEDLDSHRRFPLGIKELPESGMSELAEICSGAAYQDGRAELPVADTANRFLGTGDLREIRTRVLVFGLVVQD
ncbi:hypothetical protein R1sor_021626 [Riccia sorocarpa]|uniref:Small nuclear ribonucleoprotein Prp3 C-terminal domain-containing protein n=1 Tax=Riccia sorocarpa TaxID=122646 RepID=A0ABD3GKW8_9MARC